MFQDEAGFGRISEPSRCWAPAGVRPIVARHRIREYSYAHGAIEPRTKDSYFLVLPYSNSKCMSIYLSGLSKQFPEDMLLVCVDQAPWHTTSKINIPDNIELFYLPAATPEMNPQEPIWKELRKRGFKNESFPSLKKVELRLCNVIRSLTRKDIMSITGREWVLSII